jgi:hypothetical protein
MQDVEPSVKVASSVGRKSVNQQNEKYDQTRTNMGGFLNIALTAYIHIPLTHVESRYLQSISFNTTTPC